MKEPYKVIIAQIEKAKPDNWEEAIAYLKNLNPDFPLTQGAHWDNPTRFTDIGMAFCWERSDHGWDFWCHIDGVIG